MSKSRRRSLTMLAVVIASMIVSSAQASTAFIVYAADLQDANGALAPTGSIALLGLDTAGDGFTDGLSPTASLNPGSYWGDDLVLAKWDLSALNTPGQLLGSVNVSYSGVISSGKNLALYWFPR